MTRKEGKESKKGNERKGKVESGDKPVQTPLGPRPRAEALTPIQTKSSGELEDQTVMVCCTNEGSRSRRLRGPALKAGHLQSSLQAWTRSRPVAAAVSRGDLAEGRPNQREAYGARQERRCRGAPSAPHACCARARARPGGSLRQGRAPLHQLPHGAELHGGF